MCEGLQNLVERKLIVNGCGRAASKIRLVFAALTSSGLKVVNNKIAHEPSGEGTSRAAWTVTPMICADVRDDHRTGSGGDGAMMTTSQHPFAAGALWRVVLWPPADRSSSAIGSQSAECRRRNARRTQRLKSTALPLSFIGGERDFRAVTTVHPTQRVRCVQSLSSMARPSRLRCSVDPTSLTIKSRTL